MSERDTVLDEQALAVALADLPQWQVRDGALVREVVAPSWAAGIDLVVVVAGAADEADHHPDLDVRWTTVRVAWVSHSAGGITATDVQMAHRTDAIVTQRLPH